MLNRKVVIATALLLGILNTILFFAYRSQPEKTGYVDIEVLFNDFEMKKELEKSYTVTAKQKQQLLDSLVFELKLIEQSFSGLKKIPAEEITRYDIKKEQYIARLKKAEQENSELMGTYDEQIKTQLNLYTQEYGKKNGYTYIHANSNGSLMYADITKDLTKDVLIFINKKYAGKK